MRSSRSSSNLLVVAAVGCSCKILCTKHSPSSFSSNSSRRLDLFFTGKILRRRRTRRQHRGLYFNRDVSEFMSASFKAAKASTPLRHTFPQLASNIRVQRRQGVAVLAHVATVCSSTSVRMFLFSLLAAMICRARTSSILFNLSSEVNSES